MPESIRIIPWLEGSCSFYAIERNGICLADKFMEQLYQSDANNADALMDFLEWLSQESVIRQAYLRPERPELGVFAMYNHKERVRTRYNPSRLLCSYAGTSNRILLIESGFVKSKNEAIQANSDANNEAGFLGRITHVLNSRIDTGEIVIVGSELMARYHDSFDISLWRA
jgi:hypothetical protein